MIELLHAHTYNIWAILRALRLVKTQLLCVMPGQFSHKILCSFVAKIHDLDIAIPRNQNLIIKGLMANRRDIVDIAYISDKSNDKEVIIKRQQMLENSDV
jgi:hypothetical protein